MQYKIPVQIENEDTIFLGLSIRQIGIIMGFGAIAYSVFKNLEPSVGGTVALIFAGIPLIIGLFIALFKTAEMTALTFVMNLLRMQLNSPERVWSMGIDSASPMDIGYVPVSISVQQHIIGKGSADEKINSAEQQLSKL